VPAGCEQRAVIAALQDLGLWPRFGKASGPLTAVEKDQRWQEHAEQGLEQNAKSQAALAIWGASVPAYGTLVTTYLASRRLHLPPPTSLRFHPGLTHPSGGTWPAMVALVTRGLDAAPTAVHRTFLARDGSDKAPVEPQRMMLGPVGGGAVRLAPVASELLVGEGLETVLSGMEATGKPGWACLSTGGLRSLHQCIPALRAAAPGLGCGICAGECVALHPGIGECGQGLAPSWPRLPEHHLDCRFR